MTDQHYSYDHIHAAMCIIEEMVDSCCKSMPAPWEAYRDNNGINALRDLVIARLAGPCLVAFNRAWARYEHAAAEWSAGGYAARSAPEQPGAFDYEFVPVWLRYCVDWSEVNHPRVRGSTTMSKMA